MKNNRNNELANNLIKAIDIAIESMQKAIPASWNRDILYHVVSCYKEYRDMILDLSSKGLTIKKLKSIEILVLTRFQESSGPDIELFWNIINKECLPFKREDKIEKILKKGKISNGDEYDYVIDSMMPLQQKGIISEKDIFKLNSYINSFENKLKKK